jgi:hypothetical protein
MARDERLMIVNEAVVCVRCGAPIEPGQASIEVEVRRSVLDKNGRFHPMCLVDLDPWFVARLLLREGNRLSLSLQQQLRARLEQFRREGDRFLGLSAWAEVSVEAQEPREIELERNRQGLPCYTVLIGGTASSLLAGSRSITLYSVLRSPRREYHFELCPTMSWPVIRRRWPLIGGLLLFDTKKPVTKRVRNELVRWKTYEPPTPAIFIVGRAKRWGAVEQKARAMLDEAGFQGDAAIVGSAEDVDEDLLTKLAALLDEAFSDRSTHEGRSIGDDALVEQLRSALSASREEQLAPILEQIAREWRFAEQPQRETALDLAAQCLRFDPARRAAFSLLASNESKSHGRCEAAGEALRAMLERRARVSQIKLLLSLLRAWRSNAARAAIDAASDELPSRSTVRAALVEHRVAIDEAVRSGGG